jgi:hypothetical protein
VPFRDRHWERVCVGEADAVSVDMRVCDAHPVSLLYAVINRLTLALGYRFRVSVGHADLVPFRDRHWERVCVGEADVVAVDVRNYDADPVSLLDAVDDRHAFAQRRSQRLAFGDCLRVRDSQGNRHALA